MRNRGHIRKHVQGSEEKALIPAPTASYRRRAWVQFQRALDPLAPIKPLPTRRA